MAIFTDRARLGRWLIISDLQIPFEHKHALKFCKELQKEYRIAKTNIMCVGDEVDHYFGSRYPKDPDAEISAVKEVRMTIEKLRAWYDSFPYMRLAISNHGERWKKKAFEAQIPSFMLREYQEVIGAPDTWKWKMEWTVGMRTKYPWRMIHGTEYSGNLGHLKSAMDAGLSTAIGHIHSHAGVAYARTGLKSHQTGAAIWGMNTGCLVDTESVGLSYAMKNRNKPILGSGIITDWGRTAQFVPFSY